ncbi:Uncharacterized protein HZ326_22277 [Fusarium oxysporum f. sp. albedinis]|nr:Uncharacterized protein HZ326_22277 [Fusarium oxysporum f. sp. albedinis]
MREKMAADLRLDCFFPWPRLFPATVDNRDLENYNRLQSSQLQLQETKNNPEDDEVLKYPARDIIYLHGSRCISLHGIQLRTYRQRAWGLFDNDRLYPKHVTHFPTLNDIHQMEKAFLKRAWLDAELETRRGWSQTWQEYWFLRMPEPPGKCYDETDDEVAIDRYLGPCGRFFRACSEKLPDIGE